MLREEWRLHTHLFRGSRFALFPVFIGLLSAGAASLLVVTGTDPGTVFTGLHALAFVFGLHTGSIGLVGRDALRNLIDDLTLLVFSARTLPLSQHRLLGIFLAKDVVYYGLLFLFPITLGTMAAVLGVGASASGYSVGAVPLLWMTLTLSFVLGIGATIAALGLSQRGTLGRAVLGGFAVGLGLAWTSGIDIVAVTPYGVFLSQTFPRIGASLVTITVVFLVGALTFDATARQPARTVDPTFRRWNRHVDDPVATKTLLDMHRSSGGFGKVLFSAAILFVVTASLIALAGQITGVSPSVGISFGAILGLSGFTTYNWLTQTDGVDSSLAQPLSVADVFTAKFRAFLVLGPVVGLGFYALAVGWRGSPPFEAVVGAVLLVGVACYIFGTTVYLTGLSPNEFLFDTVLFAAFALAMIVPLVPILVAGFALAPLSGGLLVAVGTGGVALGIVGVVLYRRSLPKWERRYRRS